MSLDSAEELSSFFSVKKTEKESTFLARPGRYFLREPRVVPGEEEHDLLLSLINGLCLCDTEWCDTHLCYAQRTGEKK